MTTARSRAATPAAAVDSPDRRRLPPLLRRAWYGLNQAFRRRILHTGVTPDQFTVLRTLSEQPAPGLNQAELTRLMASDPNTVASLLERMETAGWIAREPHETDRRALRLHVKPAGRRKYVEVRQLAVELQSQVLEVLPETRREEFLKQLAIVADACRAAAEASPKRGKS